MIPTAVLLVHGMGRAPTSMLWPAFSLWRGGHAPCLLGYLPTVESFERIVARLVRRMTTLAEFGPYLVVGHSLGGLLLRVAVACLPAGVPRPTHLVQLATPNRSPRLARRAIKNFVFRFLFGDCARLLASCERMAALPLADDVPLVLVVGTGGLRGRFSPFADEPNDTVVARDEVLLGRGEAVFEWPLRHTFMMNSHEVRELLLELCRNPGIATGQKAT